MRTSFSLCAHFRLTRLLAVAGCLAVATDAHGQGLYAGTTIFIGEVSMYVDGEIENTGKVDNDGFLSLTGNWESKGIYTGEGTVELRGSTSQKVSHHGQDIHKVRIDGWGPKYVNGKINITESLHLEHGIVHIPHGSVLQLTSNAVIRGGNNESFVDGAITVTGRGYKFFPVGKNGTYAPIEFLNVKGGAATYSVEVFEDAPAVSVDNGILHGALYWHRKDLIGEFGGSAVAVGFHRPEYKEPNNIVLGNGTDWDEPFAVLSQVQHSEETNKFFTTHDIVAPLLLLGEVSGRWLESDFYFPTALSPHAARIENRTVRIFGHRLSDEGFRFQVFNRWGKVVYESISRRDMATNGWDGRALGGAELQSGTYPYRLTGIDKMGSKIEKKGVITIIH